MGKSNILKNYHLWSDIMVLQKNTILKIPKKQNPNKDLIYDSLKDKYIKEPLLYCHIIDLQIIDDTHEDDFITCEVVKIKELTY